MSLFCRRRLMISKCDCELPAHFSRLWSICCGMCIRPSMSFNWAPLSRQDLQHVVADWSMKIKSQMFKRHEKGNRYLNLCLKCWEEILALSLASLHCLFGKVGVFWTPLISVWRGLLAAGLTQLYVVVTSLLRPKLMPLGNASLLSAK